MFDDDDGIPGLDQGVQDFQQFADVFEVQAGGRLIQDIERLAGGPAAEFLGQFDPLRLAAG